jgi:fructose-1,6-bisphosphatase II
MSTDTPAQSPEHAAAGQTGHGAAAASTRTGPDRSIALEMVRVTEAAAVAGARWVGRGDRAAADAAAVTAANRFAAAVRMRGTVVIGEGRPGSEAPFRRGAMVGDGTGSECDVAIDPIDGTRLTAFGQSNAMSIMAVAPHGSMLDVPQVHYMDKLAAGPAAGRHLDLDAPVKHNIRAVARGLRKGVDEVTVVVLNRPRHEQLISEIRAVGARIRVITDGDVAGALMAVREGTGIDLLMGVGGTAEGVLAACVVACLGGTIIARLHPRDHAEHEAALAAGLDLDRIYTVEDLVDPSNVSFVATGITSGEVLRGVRVGSGTAVTSSIVMRSRSGTVRLIETEHRFTKLRDYDVDLDRREDPPLASVRRVKVPGAVVPVRPGAKPR